MLEFADNFSNYGDVESYMTDGLYAELIGINLVDDPDGVSTGKVIRTDTVYRLRRVLSSAQTTVGVGFRIWDNALPGSAGESPAIICFNDTDNAVQVMIRLNTDGTLSAYRGAESTLLGTTATPVITTGSWTHIEVAVTFSQTVGTVEIRINGVPKLELENQDTCQTANVHCAQVRFGEDSFVSPVHMKDLFIWNGSGSFNNDFLGDVQVVSLRPDSDSSFNWTASTGSTGYNLIDESTPDDTDYISADSTPPAASVFGLSDLNEDVTSVRGLITFTRALKTDGGDAPVQVSLVSNGDEDAGEDRPITVAATFWTDVSETDPDTAAPWTRTGVNAATLKVDRTV
jgi:hypothetical protein